MKRYVVLVDDKDEKYDIVSILEVGLMSARIREAEFEVIDISLDEPERKEA